MTEMRQCGSTDLGDNNEPELETAISLMNIRKNGR
jgi:hypothetical protein